jgi:hypothetical protein
MDKDHITMIAQYYLRRLEPVKPCERGTALDRAAWMCLEIMRFAWEGGVEEGVYGEQDRRLGFVQGVLWREGVFTLDDVREHNKSVHDLVENMAKYLS